MLAQLGLRPAPFWGVLLALGEFVGGLLVLFGFLTRFAAAVLGIIMLVAIGTVHIRHGFFLQNQGFEYPFAVLGMAIALILSGAGNLSIDSLWRKE